MRAVALLAVVLACAGCSRFENPIVDEGGPALDDALIGRWAADSGDEHVELRIERDGVAGLVVMSGAKEGKLQEDRLHLVTSRIDKLTYLSVQSAAASEPGAESGSWYYFRYELPTPGRLLLYADDGERWRSAVHDGIVEGIVSEDPRTKTFTVTASGAELRKFLAGYGSVIFKDEATAELHRVATD